MINGLSKSSLIKLKKQIVNFTSIYQLLNCVVHTQARENIKLHLKA